MRVGLVIYGSLDTLSGGYLYDRKLVDHLREQGDSVEVITLPWRSYLLHLSDNILSGMLRRMARLSIDVLLQDELNHPSLFRLNPRLKKQVKYPLVSIVHNLRSDEDYPAWQKLLYRRVESRYLASVDGFIFNSKDTRQRVERTLLSGGREVLPHVIAYPGGDRLFQEVPEEEIRQRALDGPLRLLFAGNVIPGKGLHVLLEALKKVPLDLWRLTVAGNYRVNPSYTGAIFRQIIRDGLSSNVCFTGALNGQELSRYMRNSHVLVMPSFYEGFGIVYLEGMGFGLPAIGTTFGGVKEIISQGCDGFLVPSGDAAALADHISGLATDRLRLVEMSLAARKSYNNHPTWKESMMTIRSFLTQLS